MKSSMAISPLPVSRSRSVSDESLLKSRSTYPSARNTGGMENSNRAASLSIAERVIIHITIDADCVTQLRRLVTGTCGDLLAFMRIQPFAHATKMKVSLCLSKPVVDLMMSAVMRSLPSAEFGRITPA